MLIGLDQRWVQVALVLVEVDRVTVTLWQLDAALGQTRIQGVEGEPALTSGSPWQGRADIRRPAAGDDRLDYDVLTGGDVPDHPVARQVRCEWPRQHTIVVDVGQHTLGQQGERDHRRAGGEPQPLRVR